MSFSPQSILDAFTAMPMWELLAVVFGIAYVLLAAKESLWTWFFAFIGTLIYTILFWNSALLSSSLLNFYYMGMAIYGFILWRSGGKNGEELEITQWSAKKNIFLITSGVIIATIVGYLSDTYTDAQFAYLDTFVMIFSILATWMLANKVLENWLYWIVIDSAAIVLYWQSGYLETHNCGRQRPLPGRRPGNSPGLRPQNRSRYRHLRSDRGPLGPAAWRRGNTKIAPVDLPGQEPGDDHDGRSDRRPGSPGNRARQPSRPGRSSSRPGHGHRRKDLPKRPSGGPRCQRSDLPRARHELGRRPASGAVPRRTDPAIGGRPRRPSGLRGKTGTPFQREIDE